MSRIPNVPERVKEAPAHALRAVFAGIGQALLLSDRMRRKLKSNHDQDGANGHGVARIPVGRPAAVKPVASPVASTTAARTEAKPAAQAPAASSTAPPAKAPATKAPPSKAPAAAPATKAPASQAPAPASKAPAAKAPAAKSRAATARATAKPAAARPETPPAAPPPIPNYDELSVASLRARLRGLDLEQVRQLLSYEKSRGSRSEIIAMYERRIAKLGQADG